MWLFLLSVGGGGVSARLLPEIAKQNFPDLSSCLVEVFLDAIPAPTDPGSNCMNHRGSTASRSGKLYFKKRKNRWVMF